MCQGEEPIHIKRVRGTTGNIFQLQERPDSHLWSGKMWRHKGKGEAPVASVLGEELGGGVGEDENGQRVWQCQ
ncbi:unnamed protein product [Camellia sinensis]